MKDVLYNPESGLLKIVILHKPEEKYRVNQVQKALEQAARMANVKITITRSNDFAAFSKFSFNPANTPIIFINESLEFVSAVPQLHMLKRKLREIRDRGSMLF